MLVQRIWVIDDSQVVCKVLEIALQRAEFAVECFTDGMAALSMLEDRDTCFPDLLLLDIVLPHMDGYAVARHFKSHLPHMPIVMVSCHDGLVDFIKARLAGALGYVTKPFDIDEIITLIRDLLGATPEHQISVELEGGQL
jgi:DNA-binding response OmpR family regulator